LDFIYKAMKKFRIPSPKPQADQVASFPKIPGGEVLETAWPRAEGQEFHEGSSLEALDAGIVEKPAIRVPLTSVRDGETPSANPRETSEDASQSPTRMRLATTPVDPLSLPEHLGRLDQEAKGIQILAEMGRQIHRLVISGFLILLVNAGCMAVAAYIFLQANRSDRALLLQITREIISAKGSQTAVTATPEADRPAKEAITGALATSKLQETFPLAQRPTKPDSEDPPLVTGPPKPATLPPGQGIMPESPGKGTIQADGPQGSLAPPTVQYLGSITSNKYHYPTCKWAKTIIPTKVRGFNSVAEAQKAGYIQCPTCRPPLADDPLSQERPK